LENSPLPPGEEYQPMYEKRKQKKGKMFKRKEERR
jgi:hypothetical protein